MDHKISWDLEDIEICKNYSDNNKNRLNLKHEKIFNTFNKYYSKSDIILEYRKYPSLKIITTSNDVLYKNKIKNSDNYNSSTGYSLELLFKFGQNEFLYEEEIINVFKYVFKNNELIDTSLIKKIELNNKLIGQRKILNEEAPGVILCFLPILNIEKTSKLLKNLITSRWV